MEKKVKSAFFLITFGYCKLQWRHWFETWSHSMPCKCGFEIYYRQKGCSV